MKSRSGFFDSEYTTLETEDESYEEDYFEEDLTDSFEDAESEEEYCIESEPEVSQDTVVKNLQLFVLCLVICVIIACIYAIVHFNEIR